MSRPTRDSLGGRAYLALRALARERGRGTSELLQLYALERFVARVAESPHKKHFVLKGGFLMADFGQRRPTRDVDLLALNLNNDADQIRDLILEICSHPLEDGIRFDTDQIRARPIREGAHYAGVRVSLEAHLASARLPFHVDVNVGDPVKPPPILVELPKLLDRDPLVVLAYPVEMVIAEKLVTAFERGGTNTRWRDFVDLLLLMEQPVEVGPASEAIRIVAQHRSVPLSRFAIIRDEVGEHAQPKWAAWRRKQGLQERTPENIRDLLAAIEPWADTLLAPSSPRGPE